MTRVNDSDVELAPAEPTVQQQQRGGPPGRLVAGLSGCVVLAVVCWAALPAQQPSGGSTMTSAIALDQVTDSSSRRMQETDSPHEARMFPMPREGGTPERGLEPAKSSSDEETGLWPGWPCGLGEEILFSKCYRTCANLTDNKYPFRAQPCKCCTDITCLKNVPVPPGKKPDFVVDCPAFDVGANGISSHRPYLPDCPYENEEMYQGLCYFKCSDLTMGKYPLRTGVNTCSGDTYKSNWTMGLGPCNGFGIGGTKCMPHIPKAAKMAFAQPGKTPGQAPLGASNWPKLNKDNVKMVNGMVSNAASKYQKTIK